jgi:CHAD domain-containing protein
MNSHQIEHIIHWHLKYLGRNAKDITSSFDKEAIHDFRVEAKKIRSILRLMASQNDNFPTGYHGKFRKVYHTAGHMRDMQLLIDVLEEQHENVPEFKSWLNRRITEQKKMWEELPVRKAVKKLKDELLHLPYESVKRQTLLNFFSTDINAIKRIINNDLISDEKLHQVRKQLKDMMYLSAFCDKEWEEGKELIKIFSPDKIVKLSAIIGEYNDQRVALEILNECIATRSFSEKKKPEQLKKRWQQQKKVQKEKLLTALHEFIDE